MKIINIGRIATFIITLLSTVPLSINYLVGTAPKNQIIVHIHVWFGLGFFIFAIISMIMQRQMRKKQIK